MPIDIGSLAMPVAQYIAEKVFVAFWAGQKCSRCNGFRSTKTGLACCKTPVCDVCLGGMIDRVDEGCFLFRCKFCGSQVTLEAEAGGNRRMALGKLVGDWVNRHSYLGGADTTRLTIRSDGTFDLHMEIRNENPVANAWAWLSDSRASGSANWPGTVVIQGDTITCPFQGNDHERAACPGA